MPLVIRDEWLQDAPRSSQLVKQTLKARKEIITKVQMDRYRREKACANIVGELSLQGVDISLTTI